MSIQVSGGGAVAVTTEALLDARAALAALAQGACEVRARLGRLDATAGVCGAGGALPMLACAERELESLADEARRLCAALLAAEEGYGLAERVAAAAQLELSRALGPAFALERLKSVLLATALRPGGSGFADPELVGALRSLADSFALAPVLRAVQALPGAELEETRVQAHLVAGSGSPQRAAAPQGFGELARRIPPAAEGQPQLRVERYELPSGAVHWVVYIAGTVDWSPVPGSEPWDLTSNVVGVAGGSAGSTEAAVLALRAAGWQPGQPVVPVGHSQGGMVASAIAASGLASVPLLVTFGSPTAGVVMPPAVLDVAVEHSDDVVPALGGSPPLTDRRLLVREAAPAAQQDAKGAAPHAMAGYRQTAAEMDASSDGRLIAARSALADFTGGAEAQVTLWRGERVSGSPAAG